jgi:hypothetical protein
MKEMICSNPPKRVTPKVKKSKGVLGGDALYVPFVMPQTSYMGGIIGITTNLPFHKVKVGGNNCGLSTKV